MKNIVFKTKKLALFVSVFAVSLISTLAKANVWTSENQWSDDWELKYKEWLQKTPNKQFFSKPTLADGTINPYYGIRVDCADLVYSLRIIFSFENKLPFAMHNPARPQGALITNQINRYDTKAPEGVERLKLFLTWIYDIASTHTVALDTYSVPFKSIGSGSIIVTTAKNHHSWTILKISKNGNPTLIFNSTVYRESGFDVQVRNSWPNPFWIFEPEVDPLDATKNIPVYVPGGYAGFRYWRPVELMKSTEATIPNYSDEQYQVGIGKWKSSAQKALAVVSESIDEVVLRLLNDACDDLKQRTAAVADAEAYKIKLAEALSKGALASENPYIQDIEQDQNKPSNLKCMIYKSFDTFSTPSRDRRFVDALVLARAYFQYGIKQKGEKSFNPVNLKIYKTIFPFISVSAAEEALLDKAPKAAANFCSIKISPEVGSLSLAEVKRRAFNNKLSSNPNDSVKGRFGYSLTANDLAAECPAYDLKSTPFDFNQSEAEASREVLTSPQAL